MVAPNRYAIMLRRNLQVLPFDLNRNLFWPAMRLLPGRRVQIYNIMPGALPNQKVIRTLSLDKIVAVRFQRWDDVIVPTIEGTVTVEVQVPPYDNVPLVRDLVIGADAPAEIPSQTWSVPFVVPDPEPVEIEGADFVQFRRSPTGGTGAFRFGAVSGGKPGEVRSLIWASNLVGSLNDGSV